MTIVKARRILSYTIMVIVVWLILIGMTQAGLHPFTWPWWAFGELVPQICMGIVVSIIATVRGVSLQGMLGFMSRIRFSLFTALVLSLSFGFPAWLFSFLPSAGRIVLGIIGLLASMAVAFSAAIAAARRIPPSQAISTCVRFVFSKPGIKLLLLTTFIGGVPGAAYPILAKYSGWHPGTVQLFASLLAATTGSVATLVAGIIIWRRFGRQETG